MCGLIGIIGEPIDQQQMKKLLVSISHRGPDHSAISTSDEWIVGHNRLAIVDLDPRSNQPFNSIDGRYTLIFNGEIYNYKIVRETLEKKGYQFRTKSDTEVVLHAYDYWKSECFIQLQGQFAISIIDSKEQKVILARDRFGEKPLFYSVTDNRLVYGSELKCITAVLRTRPLNYQAILDYMHFGFIPTPKTIYTNVFKLEPGYFIEYTITERKIVSKKAFYNVSFSENSSINENDRKDLFNEIGNTVASQISLSDVPLGAFLSGGVDSSASVYFLNRINKKVHTFTAGFKNDKFDETKFAQRIVEHLGVENTQKIIGIEDFEGLYDRMIDHYGEPHNDFSFIPTYVICKEAVKNFTVMISGDGADEIFCGYPRFHKLRQFSIIKNIPGAAKMLGAAASMLPQQSNLRRQLYFAGQADTDFFYHTMSFNFLPEESANILGPDLKKIQKHYSSRSVIENYLADIPADSHLVQKQRYLDIKLTLADDMLVKTDRASMANSLEVRPFYLHPLITDFAFSLPVEDLATYKIDKSFLKKFLENRLPHENLYRAKMGFTFPLKELIQGPLKHLFDQCIDSLPEELINLEYVNKLLQLHSLGNRNYTAQLHSLMALGRWISKNTV